MNLTQIGGLLAALLTLMVFSYLIKNNPLYRLVQHIFVGVSLGYAALLLLGNVLLPQAVQAYRNSGSTVSWLFGLPILLGVLLLFRLVPARVGTARSPGSGSGGLRALSTIALNIAVSTAAALSIGGALSGTLVPQLAETMRPIRGDLPSLVGNLIVVLGVAASLYYFHFTVGPTGRRSAPAAAVAGAGRWLILIALGATLGSLTVSFVSALVERVGFLFHLPGL